jgi:large subunit ribosomal protein L30e
MAKKVVSEIVAEIRKFMDEDKLVLGNDRTVKMLKQGKIKKIFLASNCGEQLKEDIQQYCDVSGVECVELKQSNEEIGVLCRKPFSISVVGVSE